MTQPSVAATAALLRGLQERHGSVLDVACNHQDSCVQASDMWLSSITEL